MKMETTLYEEGPSVKAMKRSMTLDFNSQLPKKQKVSGNTLSNVLASPDLQMLKLPSPELERMIISQATGLTTPTPTQFINPKHVTKEQEAFTQPFLEALNNLKQGEEKSKENIQPVTVQATISTQPIVSQALSSAALSYDGCGTTTQVLYTTALPGSIVPTVAVEPATLTALQPPAFARVKEEPQIVPCLDNTPPMSPINLDEQEVIKQERKRERNRVAARKCRERKLNRISRLEDRVSELKGQNTDLTNTASTLREQVCKLKQQIMEHVQSGCQVMVAQTGL